MSYGRGRSSEATSSLSGRVQWPVVLSCVLFAAIALCVEVGQGLASGPDGPSEASASAKSRYGKTPDTAIPFRNFQEPYLRFFQELIEYYGTGRAEVLQADTVRIGFLGPVVPASDADLGSYMLEGATLAVEETNDAGGCLGRPIELIVRQDLGLWGATSNEMVAFKYDDDVLAVLGSIDGANTHIALRVALKIGLPMVNTGTTDPTLTETNIPWLLRCMADDRQQGYALAHHVYQEAGLTRIVAFRVNDRYGRTGITEFRDAGRRLGHPLLGELRWDRGERTFDNQLERIEEMAPEGIVVWGNAHDAAAVVTELRARGMTQRVFGPDRLASRAFVEAAGAAGEGVVAASSYDPASGSANYETFAKNYRRRFGREPESFAAHAYDGMHILIDAIGKAGLNRTLIRDALYEVSSYSGVTGEIEFDTTLNDVGQVYLATVREGQLSYREVDFSVGVADPEPYSVMEGVEFTATANTAKEMSSLRIGAFLPLDESGQVAVAAMREALKAYHSRLPHAPAVELIVCDTRGRWGSAAGELVEMVTKSGAIAVIGSTERDGSHFLETMAAKLHLPVLPLCGSDATLTAIPLPWVFCTAPAESMESSSALAHDTMELLLKHVAAGARSRSALRTALAGDTWFEGRTGIFRFDPLGNRVERPEGSHIEQSEQNDAAKVLSEAPNVSEENLSMDAGGIRP